MTPAHTAIHDVTFDAFGAGEPASPGVELLAELGDVSGLPPERLAVDPDSTAGVVAAAGNGIPPIGPGETGSSTLRASDPTEARLHDLPLDAGADQRHLLGDDDPMAYEIFAPQRLVRRRAHDPGAGLRPLE